MQHDLHIKRAYVSPDKNDGCRILVDRLWPRGVKKSQLKADLWLREVAPSGDLRKWFGHDPDKWPEFRRRYRRELRKGCDDLDQLRDCMKNGTVTLLYAAKDETHNQAVVLQEFLREENR